MNAAGVTPTTAVSGAAAAITKKTMCDTPSASLRNPISLFMAVHRLAAQAICSGACLPDGKFDLIAAGWQFYALCNGLWPMPYLDVLSGI
jgi:hypothetical protein